MENLKGKVVKYRGENAMVTEDLGDSDIKIDTNYPGGDGFWVNRNTVTPPQEVKPNPIGMIRAELNTAIINARMQTPAYANDRENLDHLVASITLMNAAMRRLEKMTK